jgi:L-threonylcarbamoyladenylate synthase
LKTGPTEIIGKDEIRKAVKHLQEGKILLYPTDSLWGIGCDARNPEAVMKIAEMKNRPGQKSFISLVSSAGMLQNMVREVPDVAWDLMEFSSEPLTIVYPSASNAYRHLTSEDGKIAVRLIGQGFTNQLIHAFGRPVISTSINQSGNPAAIRLSDVDPQILKLVDHAIPDLHFSITGKPSKIIQLDMDGRIRILR